MRQWIRAASAAAVGLALTAPSAYAVTETLSYQGGAFDSLPFGPSPHAFLGGNLPAAAVGEAITGDVVLSAPLLADSTFDSSLTPNEVLAYSFSVGGHVVLSSTPGQGHPGNAGLSFVFTTVNGVISDYSVGAAYSGTKGSQASVVTLSLSQGGGDSYAAAFSIPGFITELTEGTASSPGSWSTESTGSVVAPEIDPQSALAALTLLAGSILVLRGRRSVVPRAGIEPAT